MGLPISQQGPKKQFQEPRKQKAGGVSASAWFYALSEPKADSWRGFSNLSLLFYNLLCFFVNTPGFSAGPHGKHAQGCPVSCWDKLTARGGWSAGWGASGLGLNQPHFFTPACKIRIPLSWRVAGPHWGWWFLGHLCFSWLEARANITQGTFAEKNPYVCLLCFLALSRQNLNSAEAENEQIQEKMATTTITTWKVSWRGLLAGPADSEALRRWWLFDFHLNPCHVLPSFPLPFPSWVLRLRSRIERCSEHETWAEQRCDATIFSSVLRKRNPNSAKWISLLRLRKKNACVELAFSEILLWPTMCRVLF